MNENPYGLTRIWWKYGMWYSRYSIVFFVPQLNIYYKLAIHIPWCHPKYIYLHLRVIFLQGRCFNVYFTIYVLNRLGAEFRELHHQKLTWNLNQVKGKIIWTKPYFGVPCQFSGNKHHVFWGRGGGFSRCGMIRIPAWTRQLFPPFLQRIHKVPIIFTPAWWFWDDEFSTYIQRYDEMNGAIG